MTVVDASAVVDLLAPPDHATRDRLVAALPEPMSPWLAPDVLVFEVFAVLRRYTLRGAMAPAAAARALERLRRLPIETVPTASLIDDAWELRDRFGAADSLYAALAARAGEPLLSHDQRLVRAATAAGIVAGPA